MLASSFWSGGLLSQALARQLSQRESLKKENIIY